MSLKSIILLGAPDSGKTGTFLLLRTRLQGLGNETNYNQEGADPRDFSAVYEIKNRRIYVCSMGDYRNMIEQSIQFAIENNCDTAVFAYNTNFSRTYMNNDLVPGGTITLRKRRSNDGNLANENAMNNLDANELFNLLAL